MRLWTSIETIWYNYIASKRLLVVIVIMYDTKNETIDCETHFHGAEPQGAQATLI